ncbi:MAG: c-type cytochrome [Verrucomicrobiae bacterium]|nr:c-type cytochrome [Verrucomicrobiae bacterium]NNJ43201.1 c-type cytochrome [Akkermansiaceae bacterium]
MAFFLTKATCALAAVILLSDFSAATPPRSPIDLALSPDRQTLYVAELTGSSIAAVDTDRLQIRQRFPLPGNITGLAIYGENILATSSHHRGELLEVNTTTGKVIRRTKVGQGACAPVIDHQNHRAYICNYFMNSISVVDLKHFKEITRVPVLRLPTAAALSKDGSTLYVANLLPEGPSNVKYTAAKISVIDTATTKVTQHIELSNGSNALRSLKISPDGKHLLVTHTLARFLVPTTQLDRGWINTSALTIIDTQSTSLYATVLLDDISQGAPGSWGVDMSADQQHIYVAHSGTHELSVINAPALMQKIAAKKNRSELAYDLSIMSDIRKRIPLDGNGPRPILADASGVYVAQYFSDDLVHIDLSHDAYPSRHLEMTPALKISEEREGEILFNDASHCFQKWQSCNACHPDAGRVDGLNWDILNDGIGNPKNVKSLLFSHATPPTTITGCRANAEISVRAGVTHIQFAQLKESQLKAIDTYLKKLQPEPSPYLVDGNLSQAAKRGKKIFENSGTCIRCHNGPYFTDMKMHNMNNAGPADRTSTWDTPTLREVWRTGPYLHDGRAATLMDMLKKGNHAGAARRLKDQEFDDLIEYVLSL